MQKSASYPQKVQLSELARSAVSFVLLYAKEKMVRKMLMEEGKEQKG